VPVARRNLSREARGYGERHQALRKKLEPAVRAGRARCARCGEPILPHEAWDLGHVDGDRLQWSGPEHAFCNRSAAGRTVPQPWMGPGQVELEPERDGLEQEDPVWRVPWLRGLRSVPKDATWPRLMTVPHPAAEGSLGRKFARFAEARSGRPLRWWQQLVATRLLEVDDQGRLLWDTLVLSMARQLGKSWLLRELLLWRMHQGDLFGEPQDVLHTGKDLQVCKEVLRPAMYWAEERPREFRVGRASGEQFIERKQDRSRWMLRSRTGVYGYSVSVGAVDEAWKVKADIVDEGVTPTMVEREQPQLWLVSTAHRAATSLMLVRRQLGLAQLETGEGDLLIEWSAPRERPLDDVDGWRLASPHWTPQREKLVAKQLEAAQRGELENDPEEADPIEAFRAQWLNQWPRHAPAPTVNEDLLPPGLWTELADTGLEIVGPVFVAVEDFFGLGAAVAAAGMLEDGRIEVDGWLCADWDSAIRDVEVLGLHRQIRRLQVGASMLDRVPTGMVPPPEPAGLAETRVGLALFRDLAAGRMLAHDKLTQDLDEAMRAAQVREMTTGLQLASRGPTHLVKAAVWAVMMAHRPAPVAAVY
jgi:hypothetical protein